MAEAQKLILTPTQASYSVEDGLPGIIRTDLKGGPPRYRKDFEGTAPIVNVQWVVTKGGYDYLCAFKRVFEANVDPFLIDLIIGEAELRECSAKLIPQSFRLQTVTGTAYTVTAQLDVTPPEYSLDDDMAYLWLFAIFNSGWEAWINRLHHILHDIAPKVTNTPANIWTATKEEWEATK